MNFDKKLPSVAGECSEDNVCIMYVFTSSNRMNNGWASCDCKGKRKKNEEMLTIIMYYMEIWNHEWWIILRSLSKCDRIAICSNKELNMVRLTQFVCGILFRDIVHSIFYRFFKWFLNGRSFLKHIKII